MRRVLGLSVLALVAACVEQAADSAESADRGSAGDSGTDGAFGGQPVSLAIAFRRYQVISVEDGISAGFNLDGLITADEGSGCGGSDATAADGTLGIDNGVGQLWADFYEVVGEPLQSLFEESVSRGGEIPVLAFPADRPPRFSTARLNSAQVDFDGLLAGYQTFDVEQPGWQIDLVRTDNELVFGPASVEVQVEGFNVSTPVPIEQFQGALRRGTDGIWRGIVAGSFGVAAIPEVFGEITSLSRGEALVDALRRAADLPASIGTCDRISFAAEVEAVEGFVVAPGAP